jgi:hypothetical protein
MPGFTLFIVSGTLAYLAVLGWKHDRQWARIVVVICAIVIVLAALAVAYFINALGQTNWSL